MNETPDKVPPAVSSDPARQQLTSSIAALSSELVEGLQLDIDGTTTEQVQKALAELNVEDSNSIIFFGSKAQQQLTAVSDSMLETVRTKDIGPAGDALNGMVRKLRELKFEAIDPRDKPGFLGRLFGARTKLQEYLDQYETVRDQVDTISADLERHKTTLLTDVVKLDKLYDANLDYFRTLETYIAAGRAKLQELDEITIPALVNAVAASNDVIEAQQLRDLRSRRDDLERRVHDLLLTRQVTMQSLPSIRLVQENDKSLITKINSTLSNTVPLWRQQLAQAITIYRAGQAAGAVKAATDLTNELLEKNADNLRTVNAEVRQQVERGVFDIEVVKRANDQLIATIEDSLRIADEGKAKRREAEVQLVECEEQLKQSLIAASARATATPAGRQQRAIKE